MKENIFLPADILLPKDADMHKWAVIACDQFTSDQAYWDRVRATAGDAPSTINLILPEAELGTEKEAEHTALINRTMEKYMAEGVFETYADSFVGTIRKGLIGKLDLDAYDYNVGSTSAVRATEKTVVERIPPRQRVRRNAPIELPHILMLCDDHEKVLIEPVAAKKDQLKKLYDFDLMEGGGHITGWLVEGEDVAEFQKVLADYAEHVGEKYADLEGVPMLFATGDGNHSLATAKSCYEELKANNPGADLSHHHRVIVNTDPEALLEALKAEACAEEGFEVRWYIGDKTGTVKLDPAKSELAVGVLQAFLDDYLKKNAGDIDYIHDDDALIDLAKQDNAIGFLLPGMEKSQLFRGVIHDGALPRKTFSMGHSREKRYYLEGRKIR